VVFQIINSATDELMESPVEAVLQARVDVRLKSQSTLVLKDGKKISANWSLIKDTNEDITGFVGLLRDITQIKEMEEKVVKSQQKYYDMFQNMLNGYTYNQLIFDENGEPTDYVILEVNSSFKNLIGISI
jgi:PAS domain-containing protein